MLSTEYLRKEVEFKGNHTCLMQREKVVIHKELNLTQYYST